jgi:SAM-dependent methyltransferase
MHPSAYAIEAGVVETHWWFLGRRRLVARTLERYGVDRFGPTLEVGSGTGTNLRLLHRMGFQRVFGVDRSPIAASYCRELALYPVPVADARGLPFADEKFDLVIATDVIEHVDDDRKALGEIARVLKPGGTALITVPAFPALWGSNDDLARHHRRYRLRPLETTIEASGLSVMQMRHFNYILFVPIWLVRTVIWMLRLPIESEASLTPPWLNRILTWIFAFDVGTAFALNPPFGVSILAVCRRSADSRRVPSRT